MYVCVLVLKNLPQYVYEIFFYYFFLCSRGIDGLWALSVRVCGGGAPQRWIYIKRFIFIIADQNCFTVFCVYVCSCAYNTAILIKLPVKLVEFYCYLFIVIIRTLQYFGCFINSELEWKVLNN